MSSLLAPPSNPYNSQRHAIIPGYYPPPLERDERPLLYCQACGGSQANPLHWDHFYEWELLLDDHWDGGIS